MRSISTFSPTQYNGPRCYSSWVVRRLVNGKSGPSNVGVPSHVNIFRSPIKQWLLLQWPSQKMRRRHLSKGFLGLKVGYQIKAQKKSCRTLALDVFFQLMSRLDFVMSRLGLCHVGKMYVATCQDSQSVSTMRVMICLSHANDKPIVTKYRSWHANVMPSLAKYRPWHANAMPMTCQLAREMSIMACQ